MEHAIPQKLQGKKIKITLKNLMIQTLLPAKHILLADVANTKTTLTYFIC